MVHHKGVESNKLTPAHTSKYVKPGNFSSGQLVKDSNLLSPLYLVSPACHSTRLTLPIGLWSTELLLMLYNRPGTRKKVLLMLLLLLLYTTAVTFAIGQYPA